MSAWRKKSNADAYLDQTRAAIPLIEEQLDIAHRLIAVGLPTVDSVLDLGCGDGALAASVLDRYPTATAVLVDFSAPMLDRARERFEDKDVNVSYHLADFSQPSWIDLVPPVQRFDLIVSGYAIHHLIDADKQRLFRELIRILQAGGMFINLEHVASESKLGRELFDELFIDSVFAADRLENPAARRADVSVTYHGRDDQHDNYLAAVDSQCDWMRDAGFVDVDCFFKILELAILAGRKPA